MEFEEMSENIEEYDEGINNQNIHNIAESTFFSSSEDQRKHPGRYLENTNRHINIAPNNVKNSFVLQNEKYGIK